MTAFKTFIGLCIVLATGCDDASSEATGAGGSSANSSGAGLSTSTGAAGSPTSGTGGGTGGGLSSMYPGDVGIENDPAVVWAENFEEGTVDAVTARYDDHKNPAGMQLVPDVPPMSSGQASMRLVAGGSGPTATDFFKNLSPGHDELFVRYYAKYQSGVEWHHTGVWIGGYNPPLNYPSPQAGLKPNGDDRFSVSFEPMEAAVNPRMDFYNYWMTMHSWMDQPMGSTAYYGNTLIHDSTLRAVDDGWMCVELHVKVNPDPGSAAGAELGLWVDDVSVVQFSDTSPLGYWIKDKFCPEAADSSECTDYPPPQGTQMIPLDLQYRNAAALNLNAFWPQNYITSGPEGGVQYDDMVVATVYIGCIK